MYLSCYPGIPFFWPVMGCSIQATQRHWCLHVACIGGLNRVHPCLWMLLLAFWCCSSLGVSAKWQKFTPLSYVGNLGFSPLPEQPPHWPPLAARGETKVHSWQFCFWNLEATTFWFATRTASIAGKRRHKRLLSLSRGRNFEVARISRTASIASQRKDKSPLLLALWGELETD